MLKVEAVNLHWASNSRDHKTNKFEVCNDCTDPTPVLRRGQPFRLSIKFDRPFKEASDIVKVYFKCVDVEEKSPRYMPTSTNCTVSRASQISRHKDVWSLSLMSHDENSIHIKVKSPSNIPFATYKLYIETKTKSRPGVKKYQHNKNVYFLFNPWEKGDEVYMPDTKLLDEYVLNDIGKIFISSSKKPIGEPWVFGQFAAPVLPALMLALKDSSLDFAKRGNPVHLSRELTSVLCASDPEKEKGVLRGKWKENYDHTACTDPLLWNDSVSIFDDYLKSGGKPVEFGKCWVFSAVTTTACRAIGIPCRSITNFGSANDSDLSMTVETYTETEGIAADIYAEKSSEKIWDFHCWNDVWMSRYDLPQGYGGWQAIDSTPVQSDVFGSFSCGPASLAAIKKGEIGNNYNTEFITSEVNADVINYVTGEDDFGDVEYLPVRIDMDRIGKAILTKRPFAYDPNGDTDFEDITDQYKEREGTKEERLAFFNALRQSDYKSDAYNIETSMFVEFHLKEIENLDIGDDILVHLEIKNDSISEKLVEVYLVASSLYYSGINGNQIKKFSEKISIKPNQKDVVKMRITAEEYAPKLVELAFVKINALAKLVEENYFWSGEDHFVINLSEVVISNKSALHKDKEGTLMFTLRNPLKRKLTGCKFIFEAPGIGRNVPVACRDIMPEEEVTVEHIVKPNKAGDFFITVQFDSKQLKCVTGRASLRVL